MLTPRAKTIDEIFSSLADQFIDFNPDFVYLALMDAYDEGLKHGILIGSAFCGICLIGYELVKNKNQKNEEPE